MKIASIAVFAVCGAIVTLTVLFVTRTLTDQTSSASRTIAPVHHEEDLDVKLLESLNAKFKAKTSSPALNAAGLPDPFVQIIVPTPTPPSPIPLPGAVVTPPK